MERKDLINLASESGFGKLLTGDGLPTMWHGTDLGMLERFADLVAAAERDACKEACRKIAAQYPADIWPEDGETLDCKSARMARLTAANCEREIDMRSNASLSGLPREGD